MSHHDCRSLIPRHRWRCRDHRLIRHASAQRVQRHRLEPRFEGVPLGKHPHRFPDVEHHHAPDAVVRQRVHRGFNRIRRTRRHAATRDATRREPNQTSVECRAPIRVLGRCANRRSSSTRVASLERTHCRAGVMKSCTVIISLAASDSIEGVGVERGVGVAVCRSAAVRRSRARARIHILIIVSPWNTYLGLFRLRGITTKMQFDPYIRDTVCIRATDRCHAPVSDARRRRERAHGGVRRAHAFHYTRTGHARVDNGGYTPRAVV